jgi:hypothetical protein
MNGSRTARTAQVGTLASAAAAALVLLSLSPATAFIGALTLACVPSGAAVMCWIDSGEDAAQAGLTLVLSLSVFAAASSIMIWAAGWHPRLLVALAGVGLASCVARLLFRGRQ